MSDTIIVKKDQIDRLETQLRSVQNVLLRLIEKVDQMQASVGHPGSTAWEQERRDFFNHARQVAAQANVSDEEVDQLVKEAIQAVRNASHAV